MALISRPVAYCLAGVVALGAYVAVTGSTDAVKKAAAKTTKKAPSDRSSEYTAEDYVAHFGPPSKGALRNVFVPLLRNDANASVDLSANAKDTLHVPGSAAGGDANWIFTGYAVMNGEKTALLENRSTHKSDFVKEGESWKAVRILSISSGSVVFADSSGAQISVMRFDPVLAAKSETKNAADAGVKPVDPTAGLQGPIGGPGGPGGPAGPRGPRGMRIPGGVSIQQMSGAPMVVNGGVVTISD